MSEIWSFIIETSPNLFGSSSFQTPKLFPTHTENFPPSWKFENSLIQLHSKTRKLEKLETISAEIYKSCRRENFLRTKLCRLRKVKVCQRKLVLKLFRHKLFSIHLWNKSASEIIYSVWKLLDEFFPHSRSFRFAKFLKLGTGENVRRRETQNWKYFSLENFNDCSRRK